MSEKKELTKWRLFWKIQKECFRRSVTIYLMYLFMSLLLLSSQAIGNTAAQIILGIVCVLGGMAFDAHLSYHIGADHYDSYMAGCLHRKNALFGIQSGGDHRVEREYRLYKGFVIGLYSALPVLVFGIIAGHFGVGENVLGSVAGVALVMFAGWAIIPIAWLRNYAHLNINFYWTLIMMIIPILVSGIFYFVGAMLEKRKKEQESARMEKVQELSEKSRKK